MTSVFRFCHSALSSQPVGGLVVGVLTWAWCSHFIAHWGTGSDSVLSLGLALAAAIALRPLLPRNANAAWNWLLLACWGVIAPWMCQRASLSGMTATTGLVGPLGSALLTLAPGFAIALALLTPDAPDDLSVEHRRTSTPGRFGIGRLQFVTCDAWAALAWLVAPLTCGVWPGPLVSGFIAAATAALRFASPVRTFEPNPSTLPGPSKTRPLAAIVIPAALSGMAVAIIGWLTSQLFLSTAALWCAAIGGFLLGASLGRRRTPAIEAWPRMTRQCLALSVLMAGLAVAFPGLVSLAMTISGSVSSLPMIVGLRTLIVAALLFLPGWVLGSAAGAPSHAGGAHRWREPLLALAAWRLAIAFDITLLNAPVYCAGGTLAALSAWGWSRWGVNGSATAQDSTGSKTSRWLTPAIGLASLALVLTADPAATLPAQRRLFSRFHFQARAVGVPPELLPVIDDGRLVQTTVDSSGVTSVWNHSAVTSVLRTNGMTRGQISLQPDLCPQPAPEVLSAVMPLTMHREPHHVLVTSASYPVVVATCLALPVETVTAMDPSSASIAFCRSAVEKVCPTVAAGDTRLALEQVEATRALPATPRSYDVIIAPESIIGDERSSRLWTLEHFQSIAAHLSPDGVFCQRLCCFDLTTPTIRSVVCTVQQVFPTVQLSETAPGEWLLIARHQADIGLDRTYLDRLEKPHVREVLAQAGWDWSIMLSLKTAHPADLLAACQNSGPLTASDARILYSLPMDVMRWGPKFDDRRQWMSRIARPLGDALGEEPALADANKRLSDVTLAQQIVIDHPDHFNAYRHYVRKRLQERPRPKVLQVAGEGLKNGLDPEDSRRKQYLSALGRAAGKKSRSSIDQLTAYFTPFDPLVAPFIPREFVHFDRHCESPDYSMQWRCGVRSVYYCPPGDRSVTNLCDALEVWRDHPEVVGDETTRFDAANSLLDTLKNRWGLRMTSNTTLRYDAIDADRTVSLVPEIIERMDTLHEAAGVSHSEWTARRTVLEKHLLRPVRGWRGQQSARLALQAGREPTPPVNTAVEDDETVE
jgi:hypothetical protein